MKIGRFLNVMQDGWVFYDKAKNLEKECKQVTIFVDLYLNIQEHLYYAIRNKLIQDENR